jgi:hypothetical protein
MRGELAKDGTRPDSGGRPRERWYQNRWLWLGVGVVVGAAALSPFVFDSSSGDAVPTAAALDPGPLE